MNRFIRRGFFGALAGSAAGAPLLFLSAKGGPECAVAVAAGSMYGTYVPPARGAYADSNYKGGQERLERPRTNGSRIAVTTRLSGVSIPTVSAKH
jgi:hypothetical protein